MDMTKLQLWINVVMDGLDDGYDEMMILGKLGDS